MSGGELLMAQPESRMSREIGAGIIARGGFVFKVHGGPTMMSGLTDLVGVIEGHSIWIETKMPGGVPSPKQKHVHGKIVAAGGQLIVPRSLREALDWVDGIRGAAPPR